MDSNFWFYTLSAIPQTLAAMVALSATFVIFKLSYIENSIDHELRMAKWFLLKIDFYSKINVDDISKEKLSKDFETKTTELFPENNFDNFPENKRAWVFDEFHNMIDSYDSFYGRTPENMVIFLKKTSKNLSLFTRNKSYILRLLKWSIIFTVIPIVFSLIFLPTYNLIQCHWIPVFIATTLSIWALIFTSQAVWKIATY